MQRVKCRRIPGKFFHHTNRTAVDHTLFLNRLRNTMHRQCLVPTKRHGKRRSYVPDALQTATHVFVRLDVVKAPLQRSYDGPFLVIKRNDKFFTINKNGCSDTVCIDRIKPAFIEKMRQVHVQCVFHLLVERSFRHHR